MTPIFSILVLLATVTAAFAKPITVQIAWHGDYPHNKDRVWSKDYDLGWSKNFLNGTPQEHGQVRKDGVLNANVYLPKGQAPFPFVVLLHGCDGWDKEALQWIEEYARKFNEWGYGVLALDSFTTRHVQDSCGHPDGHWGRRRSEDAYSALDYLAASGYAKMDHVDLIGRSNGGLATIMALEKIMNDHPHKFRAGVAMVPTCGGKIDVQVYAPLLIVAAGQDDANDSAKCEALAEHERTASKPIMLIVYRGAFHGFMDHVKVHKFHGWRLGYDAHAANDTLTVIDAVLKDENFIEPKIEWR